MKITQKKIDTNTLLLSAKISQDDYSSSVNKSLGDYQKKMNVPGFRVGKVPMGLVKKKYELAIRVEEINKILSNGIQKYISEKEISILGNPLPIENKVDFVNDSEYDFEFELGIQPQVDLSKAENAKIDFFVIKPEKKEIEDHQLSLQKRFGSVQSFEKMKDGDMLNVVLVQLDKNDKPLEKGINVTTSMLVDKVEDKSLRLKFLKLKKSSSIVFELSKAFSNPVDIASMLKISKEEVANLDSQFSCQINDISRLVPAKLNDELFKKSYPSKVIKTEKEFKSTIKEELSAKYIKESDRKFFNDCSSHLMKKIKLDFPEKFLKKWLKNNIKKEFTEKEFDKEYENYLKYLSWQLIENAICTKHDIKVTNDKLKSFTKAYVIQQMQSYGNIQMGNKEIDGIVDNVLKNQKESEKMMNEVIIIELVQHFKSKMKMVKKSVSLNEFIKLANNQK